jgi:hypothetical protein
MSEFEWIDQRCKLQQQLLRQFQIWSENSGCQCRIDDLRCFVGVKSRSPRSRGSFAKKLIAMLWD